MPAAGHVIGGSGKGNYGGWLGVGDTSEALFGPRLLDPLEGGVHLVVCNHGPVLPGPRISAAMNFLADSISPSARSPSSAALGRADERR